MREHHTVISGAYEAVKTEAGIILRPDLGRIVVSGADRAAYLQGLLTNDIVALKAGDGCYAAYLTAQGRMIADMHVYELGDVLLLSLARDVTPLVLAKLDQFIFSEDVQLGNVTDTLASIAVVGPRAAEIAEGLVSIAAGSPRTLASLPDQGNMRGTFAGEPVIVLRTADTGAPGYEMLVPTAQGAPFIAAARERGAVDVDEATSEAIRIEAGVPKFHCDMDEQTIPLEAGIEDRAISLTKGCYVGQEVIIRVLHRGHGRVARRLVGLKWDGVSVPPTASLVTADAAEIGHIRSRAFSPGLGCAIALAYVQRDFVAPGTRVTAAELPAVVCALPFAKD